MRDDRFPVRGTGRQHGRTAIGPVAGHSRRSRPASARVGFDAWVRRLALDPPAHRGRARDRGRAALQGAPSPRAGRIRVGRVGTLREQSPRAILYADGRGPPASEGRGERVAPVRGRGLQGAGARMSNAPRLRRFFRLPWRTTRQIRSDVEAELAFHLEARVESLVASGIPLDAARAQALREFGDVDDARRYIAAVDRDIEAAHRRSELMRDLWHDVVYAARKLRAAPAFSVAVVATLALGIGANTAVFSVVNGTILEPLPFPGADHLVRISFTQQGVSDASTPPDLKDYRTQATLFDGFAAFEGTTANLVRDGAEPERFRGASVSANWFSLLRVRPVI